MCSGRYPLAPRWPITSGLFSFDPWANAVGAAKARSATTPSNIRIIQLARAVLMKGPFWPSARRTYLNPPARVECALPTPNEALSERSPRPGRLLAAAPRCWLPCANSSLSHSRSCSLASSPRWSSRLSIPATIRRRRPAPPRPPRPPRPRRPPLPTTRPPLRATTPRRTSPAPATRPSTPTIRAAPAQTLRPSDNGAPAQTGEDISGPCDEAEHANDPRCTGAGGERVDNSGPGSVDSGQRRR